MDVEINAKGVRLPGQLTLPETPGGVILFAHGSGSSRFSPRNRQVAETLNRAGLATLLFDLLTAHEHEVDSRTASLRFDIPLLGQRLTAAVDWLPRQEAVARLPVGLFGASTGAAAALMTAADRPRAVRAVVSRGGRPDLADDALPRVRAPTLLIVGGADEQVLALNRLAAHALKAEHRVEVVPGATHLFTEPGALEQVAELAAGWFTDHLPGNPAGATP